MSGIFARIVALIGAVVYGGMVLALYGRRLRALFVVSEIALAMIFGCDPYRNKPSDGGRSSKTSSHAPAAYAQYGGGVCRSGNC